MPFIRHIDGARRRIQTGPVRGRNCELMLMPTIGWRMRERPQHQVTLPAKVMA